MTRVFSSGDLYCCLLPQFEALHTCRSGFPIAVDPGQVPAAKNLLTYDVTHKKNKILNLKYFFHCGIEDLPSLLRV